MGYRHRRLRRRVVRAPQYVLRVKGPHLTREEGAQLKAAWLRAGRDGVAVVSDSVVIEKLF